MNQTSGQLRLLQRMALGLVSAALLLYASDWAIWSVHAASNHKGFGSVTVTRLVVAPLKGNREQYYPDGVIDQPCSQSLFPQGGSPPCWWLERHRVIFDC